MKLSDFEAKANSMGDFYVYFTGEDNKPSFLVATTDFSTPYIQNHAKFKKKSKEPLVTDHVAMWNWKSDNLVMLPLTSIKKLVPLSSVLQNG